MVSLHLQALIHFRSSLDAVLDPDGVTIIEGIEKDQAISDMPCDQEIISDMIATVRSQIQSILWIVQ